MSLLSDCKEYLQIEHTDDDEFLGHTISGVAQEIRELYHIPEVDDYTSRAIAWGDKLVLPKLPVNSISGILDRDDNAIDSDDYSIDSVDAGIVYSTLFEDNLEYVVTYNAGKSDSDLDKRIKLEIFANVSSLLNEHASDRRRARFAL